jgi:outer membrane protein OmpA-like peptidoglycan-associated protein
MRHVAIAPVCRIAAVLLLAGSAAGCVYEPYAYGPPRPRVVYLQPGYAQPARYSVPADVLFAFDSATLRPQADAALGQTLSTIEQAIRNPAIRVEGNTDSVGSVPYNNQLSLRRAQAVARWLEGHGIPSGAITEVGNGESRPVAPNMLSDGQDNPRGRALNRRVDLLASPT